MKHHEDIRINDVSDTSLWVAYYRSRETERPDALFHDPLAQILMGERGKKIAESMKAIGSYVEYTVVIRTVIIDEFIQRVLKEGIDTVINLGTGLDTRPYRMMLPNSLKWIEVDYPHIIAHKNNLLKSETPTCQLTRVALDLADGALRKKFLAETAASTKKALVLTEGVIPYLTPEQVTELGQDLAGHPSFVYWITEYMDPHVYKYLKSSLRRVKMKNAPFQFFPENWLEFFKKLGWVPKDIQYMPEVGRKLQRKPPMPWWAKIFLIFVSELIYEKSRKMSGYILFTR